MLEVARVRWVDSESGAKVASDEANNVTGVLLPIDGGYVAK